MTAFKFSPVYTASSLNVIYQYTLCPCLSGHVRYSVTMARLAIRGVTKRTAATYRAALVIVGTNPTGPPAAGDKREASVTCRAPLIITAVCWARRAWEQHLQRTIKQEETVITCPLTLGFTLRVRGSEINQEEEREGVAYI